MRSFVLCFVKLASLLGSFSPCYSALCGTLFSSLFQCRYYLGCSSCFRSLHFPSSLSPPFLISFLPLSQFKLISPHSFKYHLCTDAFQINTSHPDPSPKILQTWILKSHQAQWSICPTLNSSVSCCKQLNEQCSLSSSSVTRWEAGGFTDCPLTVPSAFLCIYLFFISTSQIWGLNLIPLNDCNNLLAFLTLLLIYSSYFNKSDFAMCPYPWALAHSVSSAYNAFLPLVTYLLKTYVFFKNQLKQFF